MNYNGGEKIKVEANGGDAQIAALAKQENDLI